MNKKLSPFLFIMVTILIGIIIQSSFSIQTGPNQDLNILLDSSSQWMDGNKKIVVKYGDFYKSYENEKNLMEIGKKLEKRFGLPPGSSAHDKEDRPIYRSMLTPKEEGIQTSLSLAGMEEHGTHYLMIALETVGNFTITELEQRKEQIEKQLRSLGLSADGNLMIQGLLPTSLDREQWWAGLYDSLSLEELERYQNGRTLSVSFYSPELGREILSGTQKMNLQISLHQDSVTNRWRVTLGTPIITMEY